MTKNKRITEIHDNLLWMGDRPGVAIMAKYEDTYTGEAVIFYAKKKTEFNKQIEEYAEKHPVE